MNNEKQLFLRISLAFICFITLQSLLVWTGLIKTAPPRKPAESAAPEVAARDRDRMVDGLPANPFADDSVPLAAPAPETGPAAVAAAQGAPKARRAEEAELILGARDVNDAADPYRWRLQLDQDDASVALATSSRVDAEFDSGNRNRKPDRLVLIQGNRKAPDAPGSLALFVSPASKKRRAVAADDDAAPAPVAIDAEAILDWEVVRDEANAPAVRPVSRTDPATKVAVRGQELAFRAKLERPAATVTKVFRIWEGIDGFEVDLKFAANGPADDRLSYRLIGPHGIPIEGEWYTTSYRDVFFGRLERGNVELITRPAYEAHKYASDPAQRLTTSPLQFAGVEDQYFATFVQPSPVPKTQEARWDASVNSFVVYANEADPYKADVTAAIESKPINVGPTTDEVVHSYKVYVGPKNATELASFGAEGLATYRKNKYWWLTPGATTMSTVFIAPLLGRIYAVTESVARLFGRAAGNYGIAIILLTMTVRLIMFPLSRKQAVMAKRMQDLQPLLTEVREKYKDDREAAGRETMAVMRRNGVNPAAGCLPAVVQLPIFVGLWQTLNNSVALRQSSFLYIRDLAAPDMAFRLPFEIPYLGQFVNILPFLVVALMLVNMKLFSPPATTPEQEQQQKMMKYIMVFMAFMFYKVPSGLGLYFITSSLWQLGERLLLPKILKTPATTVVRADDKGGRNGRGAPDDAPKGWLASRLEKLLEEAEKQKTIRNEQLNGPGNGRGRSGGSASGRGPDNGDRDGNRPRSRPPGKRR